MSSMPATHAVDVRYAPGYTESGRRSVGVVGKVTRIVDACTHAEGRIRLDDIIRVTGLPRSTTFRILKQLVAEGWIEHDKRGYGIGPKLPAPTGHTGLLTAVSLVSVTVAEPVAV